MITYKECVAAVKKAESERNKRIKKIVNKMTEIVSEKLQQIIQAQKLNFSTSLEIQYKDFFDGDDIDFIIANVVDVGSCLLQRLNDLGFKVDVNVITVEINFFNPPKAFKLTFDFSGDSNND